MGGKRGWAGGGRGGGRGEGVGEEGGGGTFGYLAGDESAPAI